MGVLLEAHPGDPPPRLIRIAAEALRDGGLAVWPTDSSLAIGCTMGNKEGLERIRVLRQLPPDRLFTLMCADLSELARYARVDTPQFRLIRGLIPGAYTFVLPATGEVPRRLLHPKRRTIGLRVPNAPLALALLREVGEPLMSLSLTLPGVEPWELENAWGLREHVLDHVDAILVPPEALGYPHGEETTVLDLTEWPAQLLRAGVGPVPEGIEATG